MGWQPIGADRTVTTACSSRSRPAEQSGATRDDLRHPWTDRAVQAEEADVEQTTSYEIATTVTAPYDEAVRRTREELAREGFGILCEIDVAATMRQKLGTGFRPYVILGACNPPLAYRALSAERDIG